MNFSAPFIKRPVMTVLVMVVLVFFGVISYISMPVSSLPSVNFPIIEVTANYPGASQQEMSNLIAAPLERQFMQTQGIARVMSSNSYNSTQIILQFHQDMDINVAAENVQQAITETQALLPKDLPQTPQYVKVNPTDTPILYIALSSKNDLTGDLYKYIWNYVGQQLGTIAGISYIQVLGQKFAFRIRVNPLELAARNIALHEVVESINNYNDLVPTGKFYNQNTSVTMVTNGQLLKTSDYDEIIIKYVDGQPVKIKDIGYTIPSTENDKMSYIWQTREGAKNVAFLAILKDPAFNTIEVCEKVQTMVDRLQNNIPKSMSLFIPFSQMAWIQEAFVDVQFTLLLAFILVVLIVYLYLGNFRNTLIPLITIPITFTGTFIFMYLFNYNLDIISLSALTLAIGFLIDDAIVVLENIYRHKEMQKTSLEASYDGSKQIVTTIISMSLCLCAVFIPLIFLSSPIGKIFHELAGVTIIAVVFSGFISLTLTPMLCSRFIPAEEKETRVAKFSKKINDKFSRVYKKGLDWSLIHKGTILLFSVVSIVLSVVIFQKIPRSFLPTFNLGVIQCFVVADERTSPKRMRSIAEELSKVSLESPYVQHTGCSTSNPTDNQSLFFIFLDTESSSVSINQVIDELHRKFMALPYVEVFMKPFPLINLQSGVASSGKADYQYILTSLDEKLLYKTSKVLQEKMAKSPYFSQVSTDYFPNAQTLEMNFLRERAQTYSNQNVKQIQQNLKYAYGETYVSQINVPADRYYVVLEVDKEYYSSPAELSSLYLSTPMSDISMTSVIETKMETTPITINHINAQPSVTLAFNPAPGVPLGTAVEELKVLAKESTPPGVLGDVSGNTVEFEQLMKQLFVLLIIAIFVIYIILGILYENFLHPFSLLISVPIGIIGGLIALLITGNTLSIFSMVGIILLIGISMKNGILVVDFALEKMEQEKIDPEKAIESACLQRFRPILMTTLSALMGAIPIALGIGGTVGEGRAPLGIAVVGGLIFSQAVTLFVIPVLFLYVIKLQNKLKTQPHR